MGSLRVVLLRGGIVVRSLLASVNNRTGVVNSTRPRTRLSPSFSHPRPIPRKRLLSLGLTDCVLARADRSATRRPWRTPTAQTGARSATTIGRATRAMRGAAASTSFWAHVFLSAITIPTHRAAYPLVTGDADMCLAGDIDMCVQSDVTLNARPQIRALGWLHPDHRHDVPVERVQRPLRVWKQLLRVFGVQLRLRKYQRRQLLPDVLPECRDRAQRRPHVDQRPMGRAALGDLDLQRRVRGHPRRLFKKSRKQTGRMGGGFA